MTYDKNTIEFLPHPTVHNFQDLTGQTFHRLTVLGLIRFRILSTGKRQPMWLCECICGNYTQVWTGFLRNGNIKSCGCLRIDVPNALKHGMRHTSEYNSYAHAKARCNNPNNDDFFNYGGRGIEFRFNSFEEFYAEVGDRLSPLYSVNRINNNGHYEKGNIEWALDEPQANNKRNNRLLTCYGREQTLARWCREMKIDHSLVSYRLKLGWSDEKALTTPVRKQRVKTTASEPISER